MTNWCPRASNVESAVNMTVERLSNRTASIQKNGERGGKARLRQGLPQFAILVPLLFHNLSFVIPETVKVALFAEDVTFAPAQKTQKRQYGQS